MPVPSNGITADVIRGVMPPYRLSANLLGATLTALPPPKPGASATWRQARLTAPNLSCSECGPLERGLAARKAALRAQVNELDHPATPLAPKHDSAFSRINPVNPDTVSRRQSPILHFPESTP